MTTTTEAVATTAALAVAFATLSKIFVVSLLGPLISGATAKRFRIPVVAGQILGGMIVGQSGLRALDLNSTIVLFLYGIGFAILLFKGGINLPLRDPGLKKALGKGMTATALAYVLAVPTAWGICKLAHFDHLGMLALLCACSSASVALRMIDERKLSGPGLTVTTTWIPLADMSTLAMLPIVMAEGHAKGILFGAVIVLATGFVAFLGLKGFNDSRVGKSFRQLSKESDWALEMVIYLIVLFTLCFLSAQFGMSTIVAGFVTGAAATVIRVPGKRFREQLKGIEAFFIPCFFVILGAKIDVRALFTSVSNLELALLIAVGALVVHIVVAKILRLPMSAGFMAASSMGLPAAMVSTGLTDGILTPGQSAAIVAAALLSLVFASIGVSMFARQNQNVPVQSGNEAIHTPESPDGQ
jgi:Kef-type K+ transport system membrane component KefB